MFTDTDNSLCSYLNGGCSDICIPGPNVYSFTCACNSLDEDRVLSEDGLTCTGKTYLLAASPKTVDDGLTCTGKNFLLHHLGPCTLCTCVYLYR